MQTCSTYNDLLIVPTDVLQRYDQLELLASGNDGTVYRCFDNVEKREVALKYHDGVSAVEPNVEILCRLESLHKYTDCLQSIYNLADVRGIGLVISSPLYEFVLTGHIFTRDEAISALGEIMIAYYVLYENGILHMDLNSSNIMFVETRITRSYNVNNQELLFEGRYQPVLIDFTLAQRTQRISDKLADREILGDTLLESFNLGTEWESYLQDWRRGINNIFNTSLFETCRRTPRVGETVKFYEAITIPSRYW